MSKNDWYGGYGFVPVKDNYEEVMSKKEMMQKKFVEMCAVKTISDSTKSSINTFSRPKSEIERRTRRKHLTEKDDLIVELRKEVNEYKKMVSKVKKEHEKTKRLRFECLKEIERRDVQIDEWKVAYEKLMVEYNNEKEKSRMLECELNKTLNSLDKKEMQKLRIENQKLKQQANSLSGNLKSARKQIQNYQLMRTGELESNEIKRYKLRLEEKYHEIDNMKKRLATASNVINRLNQRFLHKKMPKLIQKSKQFKVEKEVKKSTLDSFNEDVQFGFLSLDRDAKVIFVDLQGKKYGIQSENDIDRFGKYIGMPVRAVKKGAFVKVDYIYYNISGGSKAKAINNKKTFKVRKKAEYSYVIKDEFKGKKILIIGSENKEKYLKALIKAGADAIWHESFSDNETRIDDLAPSSDVVIVCTSHISHSVIYKIKALSDYEDNAKYQLLENDNIINVICRVRYALENI